MKCILKYQPEKNDEIKVQITICLCFFFVVVVAFVSFLKKKRAKKKAIFFVK